MTKKMGKTTTISENEQLACYVTGSPWKHVQLQASFSSYTICNVDKD